MPLLSLQRRRQERTILPPQIFADDSKIIDKEDFTEDEDGRESSPPPQQRLSSGAFEASLHLLPRTLHTEIELVFPEIVRQAKREKREKARHNNGGDGGTGREYLAIPTFHVARFSILERNERTEDERLRIFLRFRDFAATFMKRLRFRDPEARVDIPDIDGASSFATSGHTATVYDEVASTRAILGYSTFLYMGVQIVKHPRIGYEKLAVHTMVLYARPTDAEETYFEMLKSI